MDLSTTTNTDKVENVTTAENDSPTDIENQTVMFEKCSKQDSNKNSFENPLFQLDIVPSAPTSVTTDGVQVVIEGKGKGIENPVAFIEEKDTNVESENKESVIEVKNLITVENDEVKNDANTVMNEIDPLGVSNFIANQQSLEDSIFDVRKEEEIVEEACEVLEAKESAENYAKDALQTRAEFVNPLSEVDNKPSPISYESQLIETEVLVDTSTDVADELEETDINQEPTNEKPVTETVERFSLKVVDSANVSSENEAEKEETNKIEKEDEADDLVEANENLLVDISSTTNDTPTAELNLAEENTENQLVDFDSLNNTS